MTYLFGVTKHNKFMMAMMYTLYAPSITLCTLLDMNSSRETSITQLFATLLSQLQSLYEYAHSRLRYVSCDHLSSALEPKGGRK